MPHRFNLTLLLLATWLLAACNLEAQEIIRPQSVSPPHAQHLLTPDPLPEGTHWDHPGAFRLQGKDAFLVYDFFSPQQISGFVVQADHNDSYLIEGSFDGRQWSFVAAVPQITHKSGLTTRTVRLPQIAGWRYIRLRAGQGDGLYSVSRFLVYPPHSLPVATEGANGVAQSLRISTRAIEFAQRVLPLLAAIVLLILFIARYHGLKGLETPTRWTWLVVGTLGILGWWNFLKFHDGTFVHRWDFMHYYLGAKYFPEVGYTRLYQCVAVVDLEDQVLRLGQDEVIRDLRDNSLVVASEILENPALCKDHFGGRRWRSFVHDVRFFRDQFRSDEWSNWKRDHGFNAPPAWIVLGRSIAEAVDLTPNTMSLLAAIDIMLVLGLISLLMWAFGWECALVALVFLGTNFPGRFFWTGGSFLRFDWLLFLVASVCFQRKEKSLLSGFMLATSAQLRIFPAFLFLAPLSMMMLKLFKVSLPHPRINLRRWWIGALLSVCLVVPFSLIVTGNSNVYNEFIANSEKHLDTPLTNNMGLATAMSFHPDRRAEVVRDDSAIDPFGLWKTLHKQSEENSWFAQWLFRAIFVVSFLMATLKSEGWVSLALAVGAIPFFTQLTCYYYSFLLILGTLTCRYPSIGIGLLLSAWISWEISLLYGWYDVLFAWQSRFFIFFVLWVTLTVAWTRGGSLLSRRAVPQGSNPDSTQELA